MADQGSCVVMVTNRAHLQRCLTTVWQLRWFGRYRGEIIMIVGNDLEADIPKIARSGLRVTPRHFPDIDRTETLSELEGAMHTSEVVFTKPFQFQKVYVFDVYFKQWSRILYLDTKMRVLNPISKVLDLDCSNSLVAHSDSFPDFTRTFESQFNVKDFPELAEEADLIAPLGEDYFQTGMMLFDSKIIAEDTVEDILKLARKFINSNTNEQAIINLWAKSRKLWKKLPTSPVDGKLLYDYWPRESRSLGDYVLLKRVRRVPDRGLRRLSNLLFHLYWRVFSWTLRRDRSIKAMIWDR
jgi:hypothetical protein